MVWCLPSWRGHFSRMKNHFIVRVTFGDQKSIIESKTKQQTTLSTLCLPLWGQYSKDQGNIVAGDAKACANIRMIVKTVAQKALPRNRILQCLPKKSMSQMGQSKEWTLPNPDSGQRLQQILIASQNHTGQRCRGWYDYPSGCLDNNKIHNHETTGAVFHTTSKQDWD